MSSEAKVLNPLLYHRLQRRFGRVAVSRRGEARVAWYGRDVFSEEGDGPKWVVRQPGEQYQVRCPFCRDPARSLSVNHLYGQRGGSGFPINLAYCHNANCLARYENRVALAQLLGADDGVLEDARILPGRKASDGEVSPELPEPRTRLDRLPKGHPARRYLRGLDLDPDRVGRRYGVSYCAAGDETLARNRVIIPVHLRGQLKGWQALAIEQGRDPRRPSKDEYLSAPGLRTSETVYNLDKARQYETGIIVATPADVWGFGAMALCPLGRHPSVCHRRLIRIAFRKHAAILALPEDLFDEPWARRLAGALARSLAGRFAAVKLPASLATGATARRALRDHVAKEARARGVRVRYARRG